MKTFLTTVILLISTISFSQNQSYINDIENFQKNLNHEFKDPNESPLTKVEQQEFKGHNFFKIDKSFCVNAEFIRTQNAFPFKMKTTTNRTPTYEKYGEVLFVIENKEYKLNVYQSHNLRKTEKYKDYLFLPFTDQTNGKETYEGGRYIDLTIPNSNTITIDFNKAYNPYCAYSHTRSCPIPPEENNLDLKIKAGVKAVKK